MSDVVYTISNHKEVKANNNDIIGNVMKTYYKQSQGYVLFRESVKIKPKTGL